MTPEERRARAIERIDQVLQEERCVAQAGIVIIGQQIVESQVLIVPMPDEEEKTQE